MGRRTRCRYVARPEAKTAPGTTICLNNEMKRVLILGGTAWLGHCLAEQLLAQGYAVTCLARGQSGTAPSGATFITADRSRPGAYDEVRFQEWDGVVELAYDHRLVEGALEVLSPQAGHWTLVSSVSVYASNSEPGADEDAALVEPTDPENYAHAKVAAERATEQAVGDRLLIARPGLIAGAGDASDRFSYWVSRFALAGTQDLLVPEPEGRFVQYIDIRDLVDWLLSAISRRLTGTYNIIGSPVSFAEFLQQAARVAGFSGELVTAGDERLGEQGVSYWAGPRSLPLWLPAADIPFAQRSSARFFAAGGRTRDLPDTLEEALRDERVRGLDRQRRSGLTRSEEQDLLRLLSRG